MGELDRMLRQLTDTARTVECINVRQRRISGRPDI
jgi:hypothetical protein